MARTASHQALAQPAPAHNHSGLLRMLVRGVVVTVAIAGMVVFAALLARVTLEPSAASEPLTRTNLRPGASIRGYLAAATAAVMLAVEFTQGSLLTGRAFDIDDVLLNTTGALCAYLLAGRRLGRAVHPRPHRWWRRSTEAKTP